MGWPSTSWFLRGLAIAAMLLALPALAASAKFQEAQNAYDTGAFAAARDAFQLLTSDSSLTEMERAQARLYLAASWFSLGDAVSARKELQTLAVVHPEVKPDPNVFLPDFVALAESARKEAAEQPAHKTIKKPAEEAEVAHRPPEVKQPEVKVPEKPPATVAQPPVSAQLTPPQAPVIKPAAPAITYVKTVERPNPRPWLIAGGATIAVGLVGTFYAVSVHSKVEDQLSGRRTDVTQAEATTGSVVFTESLITLAAGAGLVGYGIYESLHAPAQVAVAPLQGGAAVVAAGKF
jgi:hypothetical protein